MDDARSFITLLFWRQLSILRASPFAPSLLHLLKPDLRCLIQESLWYAAHHQNSPKREMRLPWFGGTQEVSLLVSNGFCYLSCLSPRFWRSFSQVSRAIYGSYSLCSPIRQAALKQATEDNEFLRLFLESAVICQVAREERGKSDGQFAKKGFLGGGEN